MKIFCVTGAPGSDLEMVASVLARAGIHPALPSQQDDSITMQSWHEHVLSASFDGDLPTSPVDEIGKFWEQLASSLFVANLKSSNWSWADSHSVWLLDYWRKFDPNVRFVLVYTPPKRALAAALAAHQVSGECVTRLLETWATYNREILRFSKKYPKKTLLVNAEDCAVNPAALIEECVARWKLNLSTDGIEPQPSFSPKPLATYLAEQSLVIQPELKLLQDEMERAVHPIALHADDGTQPFDIFDALQDYSALRDMAVQARTLSEQQQQLAAQVQTLEALVAEGTTSSSATQAEVAAYQKRLAEASSENEQLLLQMHQLQEELERWFLESKKLLEDNATKAAAVTELQKKATTLEAQNVTLRSEVATAKALQTGGQKRIADEHAAKSAALAQELQTVRKQHKQLEERAASLQSKLDSTTNDLAAKTASLDAASKELTAKKAAFDATSKELAAKSAALDAASKEAAAKKIELDTQSKEVQKLKDAATAAAKQDAANASAIAALKKDVEAARRTAQEAQQDGELVLVQLHQVQEELESYFLQHKAATQRNKELEARWQRMLERNPDYCDYAALTVVVAAGGETGRLDWQFTELNAAGRSFPELRFSTVEEDGSLRIALPRVDATKTPRVIPLADLTTSEWSLTETLCKILLAVTEPANLGSAKLGDLTAAQVTALRDGVQQLLDEMAALPVSFRFDKVVLKREQVNPDYEHLWLRILNPTLGDLRWQEFEFRVSCANVRPGKFGMYPKLEFPAGAGQAPFEKWFIESYDDFGEKLELRFALPESMDTSVWNELSDRDHAFMGSLIAAIPSMLGRLVDEGIVLAREWNDWNALTDNVQRIHAARTAVVVDLPVAVKAKPTAPMAPAQKAKPARPAAPAPKAKSSRAQPVIVRRARSR